MRRLILTAALIVGLAAPAWAGWEEGHQAYARGDYDAAFREWLPLAMKGHVEAQLNLGFMYNQGLGVPQDNIEAAKWYRQTAEQGLAEAQAELGTLYFHGLGVPQDFFEAEKWSRKAALQGHPTGQFNLGTMYVFGLGVPRDYSKAATWFRKAAQQGDGPSQHSLATLYAQGLGVSQDNVQALMWLLIAARQPNDPARGAPDIVSSAIELGEMLAAQMTPAEIAEAERLAREWEILTGARETGQVFGQIYTNLGILLAAISTCEKTSLGTALFFREYKSYMSNNYAPAAGMLIEVHRELMEKRVGQMTGQALDALGKQFQSAGYSYFDQLYLDLSPAEIDRGCMNFQKQINAGEWDAFRLVDEYFLSLEAYDPDFYEARKSVWALIKKIQNQ